MKVPVLFFSGNKIQKICIHELLYIKQYFTSVFERSVLYLFSIMSKCFISLICFWVLWMLWRIFNSKKNLKCSYKHFNIIFKFNILINFKHSRKGELNFWSQSGNFEERCDKCYLFWNWCTNLIWKKYVNSYVLI